MTKLSPETLRVRPWHAFQARKPASSRLTRLLRPELIVPLLILIVLLFFRAYVMAGIVAGVSLLLLATRALSPAGRRVIDKSLGRFAHWVGQAVALVLLGIPFFFVMTAVRLTNRLTGADPLLLRGAEAPTFWLPSDLESRRSRHVRSMFCTEPLARARASLVPIAVFGILLVVAAEAALRVYGFGTPVLYVQDLDVGFYPKPNQRVRAPGRIITINNHGMRAADVSPQKPRDRIRILLLGDSTLAGTWVANEELYSSLVENKLNATAGAPRFEVMNMGVNAWGPFHELAFVKKFGTFQADVAVICGPIYNAYRPRYNLDRLPFIPETHPPRLALEQIFYELLWRYRERCLGPQPWAVAGDLAEAQCAKGMDAYAELARFLQEQGAEVLVQMLPSASETLGRSVDEHKLRLLADLQKRLDSLGLKAECAGSIFKDVQPASALYHDGVHFDRLGHRLYAEYFAGRLVRNSAKIQKALGASTSAGATASTPARQFTAASSP